MKHTLTYLLLIACWAPSIATAVHAADHPILWPDQQREFWTEGGLLLLNQEQRARLLEADSIQRQALLDEWLADPDPNTEINETLQAIKTRSRLGRSLYPSASDDRFKLLFLHGTPQSREIVDCGRTFRPIELWWYGEEGRENKDGFALVLFQPEVDPAYKLWLPTMGKGPLYTREMEYWLQQYDELKHAITGRRFDLQLCRETRLVDKATGVGGLVEYRKKHPTVEELTSWLEPPKEIGAWSRQVTFVPNSKGGLSVSAVQLAFPKEQDPFLLSSFLIRVPVDAVQPFEQPDTEGKEYRISVAGEVERFGDDASFGTWFEDFRLRFRSAVGASQQDLALIVNRRYRPGQKLLARVRIRDEVSGREALIVKGFVVPSQTNQFDLPPSEEALEAIDEKSTAERIRGRDSILLIPPETDLVLGLWRAEVLVTGQNIERVTFAVDGVSQFRRNKPPFTAELRLAKYPQEQIVRVEGIDANGTVVAADEIVLNQQRGALRVRVTDPPRGGTPAGKVTAAAQITVPEERRLETVEFLVNNQSQAVLTKPPWRTQIEVPEIASNQDIAFLTVVATLDDGSRSEEVRFLNVPAYLDVVDVDLVELYTTVTEGNRLVLDAQQEDFTILEDGRRQQVAKFELVQDRPLTVGITIDTSGSMIESLGEARRAAVEFLSNVVTPRDQTFAVAFADRPELLMPRTSDVGAVAEVLEQIGASGNTALNDAIVTSLYYFRGVRGRKVLVLLSDGEDTASSLDFRSALEYARRSGVVVYTVGLGITRTMISVRNSLNNLAQETGGRSFYIHRASELRSAYARIEKELRSQYLLAYQPDRPAKDEEFREVQVKVKGGKRKARTISGYYP